MSNNDDALAVESYLQERPGDDPRPAPEDACVECGEEAIHFWCHSCGRPLCAEHQERGAGYCSDYAGRDEGCQIGEEGESA